MSRNLLTGLLLACLVLLAWWQLQRPEAVTPESAHETSAALPEYYLRDAVITRMGADGQPVERITATHMDHYGGETGSILTGPAMTLFDKQHSGWQLSAQQAWLDDTGQQIRLTGDVRILQLRNEKPFFLQTASLLLKTGEHYAETVDPVRLTQGDNHIDASGLQLWIQTEHLELSGRVRGLYVP